MSGRNTIAVATVLLETGMIYVIATSRQFTGFAARGPNGQGPHSASPR